MPEADDAALVMRGVTHRFGSFVAVDDVGLSVPRGSVHCLLGPSGSGKTTLLRLVAGLERLQQGEIRIGGEVVASAGHSEPPERRAIGFVFQDYALFPHLDVLRNVTFGMVGRNADEKRSRGRELLERVGMGAFVEAMPHTLSGGQQQRVALARALARHPAVMLLDEPFSGLDARLREEVRRATLEVLRASGVGTLIVTHDPQEALLAGDRVSVLREGRLVQTGSADEVYLRSVDNEVAEVFGPVNRFIGLARDGSLETPWGPVPLEGAEDGAQVEASIRSESIVVRRPTDPAPSEVGVREVPGVVVAVERTGGSVHVLVQRPGGANVQVWDLARRGWRVGEEVLVSAVPGGATIRSRPSSNGPG